MGMGGGEVFTFIYPFACLFISEVTGRILISYVKGSEQGG